MTLTRSIRTAAATLLVAAAVVLLPQGAAQAAGCSGSTGVTVVVDFNELNGGSLTAACVPNGGGKIAWSLFESAGYELTPVTGGGGAGAVCQVQGYPANAGCASMPPASAYWSLWWSDGKSGRWGYSAEGAAALEVSDGGYVGFSWHQGTGKEQPPDVTATQRVFPTPTAAAPSAAATKKPGAKKSSKPTSKPSASTASATPSLSATPSATDTTSAASPTEATTSAAPPEPSQTTTTGLPAIDEITDGPEATSADTNGEDSGGFPAWLGIGLVVVVLGAAGAVPLIRRRKA